MTDLETAQDAIYWHLACVARVIHYHQDDIRYKLATARNKEIPEVSKAADISEELLRFIEKFDGNSDSVEQHQSWPDEIRTFLSEIRTWDDAKSIQMARRHNRDWQAQYDRSFTTSY